VQKLNVRTFKPSLSKTEKRYPKCWTMATTTISKTLDGLLRRALTKFQIVVPYSENNQYNFNFAEQL
jgi:hypothetical protein